MEKRWNTVRQVLSVNEDKAILVGGFIANRTGNVKAGMFHILWSDGEEQYVEKPID